MTSVVMTHHHFDHVLGGGAFGGVPRYAARRWRWLWSSGLPDLCAEAVRYGADPAEVEAAARAARPRTG